MSEAIKPFRIAVGDAVLDDLRSRLRNTRWPEAEVVDDWSQGTPLAWIKEVCHYWADGYDWRKREALLNRFAQYTTEIDGLAIHFLHVRSPHPGAMPLVITHGWPGSVIEFQKVIAPLTNPTAYGATPPMPSTWYAPLCRASASRPSPGPLAGGWTASPPPGRC